jgi:hypothetical protein
VTGNKWLQKLENIMKNDFEKNKNKEKKKKKYKKPEIIYEGALTVQAGTCNQTYGCTPNFV